MSAFLPDSAALPWVQIEQAAWLGCPCSLYECFEDERKLLTARKWWIFPSSSSPQYCLLVEQAVAQQLQSLPTLLTEWDLGFYATSARSIPSATSYLLQGDVSIFHLSLDLPMSCEEWSAYYFLFQSVFLTHPAYIIPETSHACYTTYQSLPSQFFNLDAIYRTPHFITKCNALSTAVTQCMYFTQSLLF
jgi:hypothetical protein